MNGRLAVPSVTDVVVYLEVSPESCSTIHYSVTNECEALFVVKLMTHLRKKERECWGCSLCFLFRIPCIALNTLLALLFFLVILSPPPPPALLLVCCLCDVLPIFDARISLFRVLCVSGREVAEDERRGVYI